MRPYISIDPSMLSGTPCINGTRLPVYMIAEAVWSDGVKGAMQTWPLERKDILTACWFAGLYGSVQIWETTEDPGSELERRSIAPSESPWVARWADWAESVSQLLWAQEYSEVPDPPMAQSP